MSILHSDKGRAYVKSVAALAKGMTAPNQFNSSVFFSLEDYNEGVFSELPDGIKEIIKKSPEWQELGKQDDPIETITDDIPFS